jgi:hypothetical protein
MWRGNLPPNNVPQNPSSLAIEMSLRLILRISGESSTWKVGIFITAR